MKITDCYKRKPPAFSFEFFPPKTPEAEGRLWQTVAEIKTLNPSFTSVTYGAMGTTRENTIRITARIKKEFGMEAACHLTCVGHTRGELEQILGKIQEEGIENLVALRGDPPQGETLYQPVEGGFRYASELVAFIRNHPKFKDSFGIAVGGYPEGHQDCPDKAKDLQHLKQKMDQGADVIITQLFFDNRDYFDFVARARKLGIGQPIVPGIMPVANGAQIKRIAAMCGAKIPPAMQAEIDKLGDNHEAVAAYGIEYAARQCRELLEKKVPGIHFYTLNKRGVMPQIFASL